MRDLQNQVIYVVDDDQGILDSFDAMLGDDYPVVMFNSGTKALDVLQEKTPTLLFLDIKMPGINGIELLKSIHEKGMCTKVVIVTALPQDSYEQMARQYGVYKYLKKPLDVDEVEGITRNVLH
ncbi:response regulator [Desulfoferrobacter suflitae]|uniref:response regulator n=1 Tax=Desulfoferrobacter suflitae TaxID=2865782 RepID=UPI0021641FA8|nr:response regulator [Desulfoferrobacter suflitae]MCK8601338.1 response regulator [Desulfoferrobacter suflitae]